MKLHLAAPALVLLFSCATGYSLSPVRDESVEVDGHDAQIGSGESCDVAAWSVPSGKEDLLVELKVTNRGKGKLELPPSAFSLSGPAFRGDTLKAVAPDAHLAKLLADAENLEKRSKLDTYKGVQEIATAQKELGSRDKDVERAKRDHEADERQKKADVERAAELRPRHAELKPLLSSGLSVASGAHQRETFLFSGPFARTGLVNVSVQHPRCAVILGYKLKD